MVNNFGRQKLDFDLEKNPMLNYVLPLAALIKPKLTTFYYESQ